MLSCCRSRRPGAVVTGIRQNAAFRTNVGFAAGEDGAAYTLTLKAAAGNVVATGTGSLGSFGWTQPSVADLFPGTTIPDDATLLVKVTSGSVDIFDSSIDNTSGDSVITRIALLPTSIPSAATIGPLGGAIRSGDGILTLRVPAGALATPTPMSIATTTSDAPAALGSGYNVSPAGLSFAKPALLGLRYGTGGLVVNAIEGVAIAVLTGAGWAGLTGGNVDTSSRTLLMRLQSTSPADAPAAARLGRAAQAAQAATLIGTSRALAVKGPEWLPTDGTADLVVEYRSTPSSAGAPYKYEFIGAALGAVNVTWSKPSLGSLDHLNLPQARYTAPNQVPDVFTVVKSKVAVRQNGKLLGVVPFSINVIRRNWRLDVFYFLHIKCDEQKGDASIELSGDGAATYQTFSFADDLTFHPNLAPSPAPATVPTVTSCKGCTEMPITVRPTFDVRQTDGIFLRELSRLRYIPGLPCSARHPRRTDCRDTRRRAARPSSDAPLWRRRRHQFSGGPRPCRQYLDPLEQPAPGASPAPNRRDRRAI